MIPRGKSWPATAAVAILASLGGFASAPGAAPSGAPSVSESAKSEGSGGKFTGNRLATFAQALRAARFSKGAGRPGVGGYIGRGWTVAQDRRRARKARNVARNRKAHR